MTTLLLAKVIWDIAENRCKEARNTSSQSGCKQVNTSARCQTKSGTTWNNRNYLFHRKNRISVKSISDLRAAHFSQITNIVLCISYISHQHFYSTCRITFRLHSLELTFSSGGGGVGSGVSPGNRPDHRSRPLQPTNKRAHFSDRWNVLWPSLWDQKQIFLTRRWQSFQSCLWRQNHIF